MWQWLSDWKRQRNAAKFDYTSVDADYWRCNYHDCGQHVYHGMQKVHAMSQHGFRAPDVHIHPINRVLHVGRRR